MLTSLRFPAAFAIVLYHFLVYTTCPQWIWFGLGAGVSFFYVLSGFILYYNYGELSDRTGFWVARAARIWPVHLATLVLAFLLVPFEALDGHASIEMTLPLNLLLLHAWLPFQGSVLSFNGVSWSLSVEIFFYICFPWLLARMKREGPSLLLIGSFAMGTALILTAMLIWPAHAVFVSLFNPACRIFEFILGMATCRLWLQANRPTGSSGVWLAYEVAALVTAVGLVVGVPQLIIAFGIKLEVVDWLGVEVCALSFATLIWVFAHQAGALSRLLSTRFLTWLGEISFALYMCHQVLVRGMGVKLMTDPWEAIRFFVLYLPITMAVSIAIYHLIETPARKYLIMRYRRQTSAGN